MFVLLITLLGIALTFVCVGLLLSIPKTQAPRAISYAARSPGIRRTTDNDVGTARTSGSVGVARAAGAYRAGTSGEVRRASIRGQTGENRYAVAIERGSESNGLLAVRTDNVSRPRAGKPTPWLGLTFILLALFAFSLFSMKVLFSSPGLLMNPFISDGAAGSTSAAKTVSNQVSTNLAGISKALVRIGQLEPAQYASQQEFDTWGYSACSAAAMTEVINAYGHHYRITDILKVEANLKEITPEQGLLETAGIGRTVAQFGFKATILDKPSLDDAVRIANQGTPLIVNFPPDRWQGGHILVLLGGTSTAVNLADSSKLNLTSMSRDKFLSLWGGLAVSVVPA